MPRPPSKGPTEFELELLKILWELGPSTVRDIHASVAKQRANHREVGLTTVLKILQVMRDKGLVACDTDQRPQLYSAAAARTEVLGQFANDMLQRVFDGSATLLLQHAISGKKCTPEELAAIRKLIDQQEEKHS